MTDASQPLKAKPQRIEPRTVLGLPANASGLVRVAVQDEQPVVLDRSIVEIARAIARGLARADYENQDDRGMLESVYEN